MNPLADKKTIIFSYGPVPTPEHDKVEGGGLRCWGLAKGLRAQDKQSVITVAYNDSYRKENFTDSYEDINITTWSVGNIKDLVSEYDTVIVSYCMGDLSVGVVKALGTDQQLVLDCYVPIYVEISARQSDDVAGEYAAFNFEVNRWAEVLRRGDLFLCANPNQKRYYQGVLSALGKVNPATYNDELILTVPYGVYKTKPVVTEKPITKLIGSNSRQYKKLLWFGAIYPWFDLTILIDAISKINETMPVKLVIVGAKNPFNAHPDFVRSYDKLIEYIDSNKEHKENIILQDWIEFSDRANWYLDSDAVILINKIGSENELAWRTRLVDYIWADLPIITNGGDPLGEELIGAKAATRIEQLDVQGLTKSIKSLLGDSAALKTSKNNLKKIRDKYYWDEVLKPLYAHIQSHSRPTDVTTFGLLEAQGTPANSSLLQKVARKAYKLPAYYRKYGARNTYSSIRTMVGNRGNRLGLSRTQPAVVFVAHQLDTTGAPHVFLDLVHDFRKMQPKTPVDFHTFNPAKNDNIIALNKLGIKPKLHVTQDISIPYVQGDTVVLNTVAFSDIFKEGLFQALENGTVKKVIWYIHEDEPDLIFNKRETARIKQLLNNDKIEMFIAAVKARNNYRAYFDNKKNINKQMHRVEVPKKFNTVRKADEFSELNFILPGMVGDGRKGQLPILYAFIEFKKRFYDKAPDKYRDFSLTYIGLGGDFLSRQLLKHTSKGLGEHFSYYGAVSHTECLELVLKANITLCYSLRECLPLFVYEGMASGHPIMRNDSSGMEEQLKEGENGFYLDSTNFEQVIGAIEAIANKDKTTNKQLAAMSTVSHQITEELKDLRYTTMVEAIEQSFRK